jgi:hypothetical protein
MRVVYTSYRVSGGHWRFCYIMGSSDDHDIPEDVATWLVPGTFDDNGDPLPEYSEWT